METQTQTLTGFLLARLDEDEAAARQAYRIAEWREKSEHARIYWARRLVRLDASGPHIARHDPARVLAEVGAKRRIVELHEGEHNCTTYIAAEDNNPCKTLEILAVVYDDHPDYRDEWRP